MIVKIIMYGCQCDNCKIMWYDQVKEHMALTDVKSIQQQVHEDGWITREQKHYCNDCHSFTDEDQLVLNPERVNKHI